VNVEVTDEIEDATIDADVIATDTWVSMGDEQQNNNASKISKDIQ